LALAQPDPFVHLLKFAREKLLFLWVQDLVGHRKDQIVVGFRLISSGLVYCLSHPDDAQASGCPLEEVQRLFTKLA
jgi:hypothetical protein